MLKILRDIFRLNVGKTWFNTDEGFDLIKTAAILIMQLLHKSVKSPFAKTNPTEIAYILISEKYSMIQLLSECI